MLQIYWESTHSGKHDHPELISSSPRAAPRAVVLGEQGNGMFPERRMSALEQEVEGSTSAVSEARDGEANEAEGICRFSAYGTSFRNGYLKPMTRSA